MTMELKEILAISGQPGLYKYVAQSGRGIIVEALSDGKRTHIPASSKVSSLSEIAIYTEGEDLPLADVFEKMYAYTGGKPTISHKSEPAQMKELMDQVLPEWDRDRVHVSDIKKLISWFNILVGCGMTEFKSSQEEEEKKE